MSEEKELSQADKVALMERGYEDPVWFMRFFLAHWFPTPLPWFHRATLAVLHRKCAFLERYGELDRIIRNFTYERDGKEIPIFFYEDGILKMRISRFTEVMMPRGFSKTTLLNGSQIYDIVYQEHPFSVYLSEAGPHANMQAANVKSELEVNPQIIAVFGNIQGSRADNLKWSEDFYETTTGIAVAAKGRGAQVRGLNHKGKRPSKILLDDVEDKESVATEFQRKKTRNWLYGDVLPALPKQDPNATVVALGTLLHEEALLQTVKKDPDWTTIQLGALDKDGVPIWPYLWDRSDLDRKKQSFARVGELSTYYMEYHNEFRADAVQTFRSDQIIYKMPEPNEQLETAIYLDPAISDRRTADHAAIAVCGMNERGFIYTLESWGKLGATPRELVDKFFELSKLHRCRLHGIESNAYQAALVHLVKEEMFRKKHYFEVQKITHKTRKEERILGILQPRYAAGYIYHSRPFPMLETQLKDFRRGAEQKDDYIDAQAGCIALLDPVAGLAADDNAFEENSLPPLEEVMGGDWRSY